MKERRCLCSLRPVRGLSEVRIVAALTSRSLSLAMKPSRVYACTALHGSVCAASRLAEPRPASLSMCRSIVPLKRERSKCTLSGQKSPSREVVSESQSAYHSIVLLSLTNHNFSHLDFFFWIDFMCLTEVFSFFWTFTFFLDFFSFCSGICGVVRVHWKHSETLSEYRLLVSDYRQRLCVWGVAAPPTSPRTCLPSAHRLRPIWHTCNSFIVSCASRAPPPQPCQTVPLSLVR